MPQQYLLLFTIGPVQSFIAQARKTSDLAAGSRILSDLIKTAIDAVGRENIVFPYAPQDNTEWNDIKSLPNRFVAMLSSDSDSNVEAIAQQAKERVESKWEKIAQKALGKNWNEEAAAAQVSQHLDINWVAIPCTDDYRADYAKLEQLMGAIKNSRTFSQFSYNEQIGEQGRKCSLDGERNALFYRPIEGRDPKDKKAPAYITSAAIEVGKGNNLDQGEALSAVSYVKRIYSNTNEKTFESTAEIALLDVLTKMNNNSNAKMCKIILLKANAQLFFEENALSKARREKILKNTEEAPSDDSVIERCYKNFWKEAKEKKHSELKYYAILTFDGDSMGKWLSGDTSLLPEKDVVGNPIDLQQFQKDFSRELSQFAKHASEMIDKEKEGEKWGRTVYAGGDDFLGFINLNYLFKALISLRKAYREMVSDKLKEKYGLSRELSFSAGICIAHYKEPLSIVLKTAHEAQEAAKNTYEKEEKDAFGLTVIKGSGEVEKTVWKNYQAAKFIEILRYFRGEEECDAHEDWSFSTKLVVNLQNEFVRLINRDGFFPQGYKHILEHEIKRIAQRQYNSKSKNKDKDKEFKLRKVLEMSEHLIELYDQTPDKKMNNYFSALNILRFMYRQINEQVALYSDSAAVQ